MGEANLKFARGETDIAIRMCMEVIRQDPAAPEPFQTLSTIYESTGEFEKSVQFAVIGAHLAPPDPDEWERLANMSLELGIVTNKMSIVTILITCLVFIKLHFFFIGFFGIKSQF